MHLSLYTFEAESMMAEATDVSLSNGTSISARLIFIFYIVYNKS